HGPRWQRCDVHTEGTHQGRRERDAQVILVLGAVADLVAGGVGAAKEDEALLPVDVALRAAASQRPQRRGPRADAKAEEDHRVELGEEPLHLREEDWELRLRERVRLLARVRAFEDREILDRLRGVPWQLEVLGHRSADDLQNRDPAVRRYGR